SKNIPEEVLTYARTMAFVVLAASQLFYSLSMRSATKSIFQVGLFTNKALIGAIIVGFILQIGVISIPVLAAAFKVHTLSVNDWLLVIGFALIPLMVNELIKVFMRIGKTKDIV
ncbi:MAG TPA: cation-translocating P-type ATPase C-terminal domain-containing protein, partial [Clostridiaceae bacterium]|nr:cation-translocating P-type ATPase C-terminal domain-containing protein [Clostridiaceae bacterium]